MKMKTSELKGAALDWAVDVAEDGHCHKVEMISDYILGRNEGFLSDGDYIYGDNHSEGEDQRGVPSRR